MRNKREYLLLAIFAVVFVAAGIWLYQIWNGYQQAEQEYQDLRKYVKEIPEKTPDGNVEQQEQDTVEMSVDFEKLKQINEDIVAWIRIPGVLDYPVVQGKDNEHYLHYTFEGQYHIAGSIFLDCRNTRDFSNQKNIIYGHNMKDGSMFYCLRQYQSLSFLQEHQEIEVYLPDGRREVYRISSCEEVEATGEAYQLGIEEAGNKELLLSTCSTRSEWRVIVSGNLEQK